MRYAFAALLLVALIAAAGVGLVIAPITIDELRDIVIIVYGMMGVLLFIVLIAVTIGLWAAVRVLSRSVMALLEDPVRPTLQELRDTARNVRGASDFLSDTAVRPVIRVIAIGRGVRRGLGMVCGLAHLRRRR